MYAGEIPVDDPAMLKAYEAFAEFGASGLTNPDAGQLSNGDSTAGFVGGQARRTTSSAAGRTTNMVDAFGEDVSVSVHPDVRGRRVPGDGGGRSGDRAVDHRTTPSTRTSRASSCSSSPSPRTRTCSSSCTRRRRPNHKDGDPSLIQNPLLQQEFALLQEATDGVVFAFDSVMPQATIDLFYRVNAGVFLGSITPEDAVRQLAESYATEIANQ